MIVLMHSQFMLNTPAVSQSVESAQASPGYKHEALPTPASGS